MNLSILRVHATFVGLLLFSVAAVAAQESSIEGWGVHPVKSSVEGALSCVADGPIAHSMSLTIATLGPQLFILFESKTIPSEKTTRPVTMSIDGNNPVTYRALSGNSVLSVLLIRDLEEALRPAKNLRATIDGQEYAFHIENAGEAIDAVSRCAGMPDHAERLAHAPKPIAGAGNWTLVDKAAAMNGCIVRVNGAEVDTTMTFNNKGQVLLIAGHPEWAAWPGDANIKLQIDSAPPELMKASPINNIVVVSIMNDTMLSRLRQAKTLSWDLPTGKYRSDVSGLNVALDALAACNTAKRTGH